MATADDHAMQFLAEMTREPGRVPLRVQALTRCDCGCGLPDRVEFELLGAVIALDDPVAIDALADMLADARAKLWGPRPEGGGP